MRWAIQRTVVALILGAASPLSPLGCSSPEERAEEARQRTADALARGDRRAALAALVKLRESQPDTPEALARFAALLVQAGEAPRALWLLEEGLERFPGRDDLRLAAANAALLLNDPARARAHLERIPPESEYHAPALLTRARAELELGRLEPAFGLFEEAQQRYPELPQVRVLRIQTLLQEGRIGEARAVLEEARQSIDSPDDRRAMRRAEIALYTAELARGQTDLALAGLAALVDEDPDDVLAWQSFAQANVNAGQPRVALERLRASLEKDPERLALYSLAAAVHVALGEPEQAEALLREFVERSGSATSQIGLAQFYAMQGDQQRSLELFREAAEAFPGDADVHFARAEALLAWGLLDPAQAELTQFRRVAHSADPRAEYLTARVELAEGDAEAARRRLQEVVPRFDTAVAQYWLGAALEALGDTVGADRRYRMALRHDITLADAHRAVIRLAENRGDWRAVAGYAQSTVRFLPGQIDGWFALVNALSRLRRTQEAERAARRAVELFPDRAQPRALLVRALSAQGHHAEALTQLEEARDHFGSTPELQAERALALGMAGRMEEAISAVREALETTPDSARLHLTLGMLRFEQGRAGEGVRAVDRALELDPGDPWPLRVRAEFRTSRGRFERAREDTERYLALRPDDARMHFLLGVIHERSGRIEPAINAYRRAAELDPEGFLARNNLAELLASQGDLDAALAVAQEAYRIAQESPHVLDTLGGLYLRKGLPERAISFLEDAHAAQPEWPGTQLRLAMAYRDAGRGDDARRLLFELRSRDTAPAEFRTKADEALRALP